MDTRYNPQAIEGKWQKYWQDQRIYFVERRADQPKFYNLVMFPYPSGDLHMGHMRNYAIGDLIARYHVMLGYNVMNPMGWDSFGLPAENAAIAQGLHPQDRTLANIARMKEEFFKMGIVYDWDREVASCLPDYYRWTQWMFLLMYRRGLAYKKLAAVNWCPNDQTVLANEQVVDGRCERCGAEVIKKDLNQWFFRITQYAERLLDDLDTLEHWPDRVRLMQRNWIGRSEGAELAWPVVGHKSSIKFFTTRPDTVYGATFMVLAPEHLLVHTLSASERDAELAAYITQARKQTDIERQATDKEKTGVFIGTYCTNPFTGQNIPIYIADYVLVGYGTGAIMAVPGGDERDYDFALKYNIPIIPVVAPEGEPSAERPATGDPSVAPVYKAGPDGPALYTGPGRMINSGPLDGLPSKDAKAAVITRAESEGAGKGTINYRLRDWLISRQRYWGAPIPIVYCDGCGEVPVPEDQLPVVLPYDVDFRPSGESPLARHATFAHTTCPQCGGAARRETDTMDTFVDSSWYFLRFCDPHNTERPFDPELVNYWMPVNQYVGGVEHAILHLMYARFFTKVLADEGLVAVQEPFARLFTQGMITKDGAKMSKSKGNVVPVDDMVEQYGADTSRLFVLFIGPSEVDAEWSDTGVEGSARFLQRVWRLYDERVRLDEMAGGHAAESYSESDRGLLRKAHQTIRRVTDDIARFHFNTAISATMELVNTMTAYKENHGVTPVFTEAARILVLLLAPITPHITEELWHTLGGDGSIHRQPWPRYDAALAAESTIMLIVQVNGKVRDRIEVPTTIPEADARAAALSSERVVPFVNGREPRQVIYVPGKLVNIVV